jgi:hypothetical protein
MLRCVDGHAFIERLAAALPEWYGAADPDDYVDDQDGVALPYIALGFARIWLEDHAMEVAREPMRARVRPGFEDVMARWWAFVEAEAERARTEPELATLL